MSELTPTMGLSLAIALNVFALSKQIIFGLLLLAINVFKHLVNSLVNKFGTNSKYTSLLTMHDNIRIYAINLSWSLNDKMYQEHTFVIDMVTLPYNVPL